MPAAECGCPFRVARRAHAAGRSPSGKLVVDINKYRPMSRLGGNTCEHSHSCRDPVTQLACSAWPSPLLSAPWLALVARRPALSPCQPPEPAPPAAGLCAHASANEQLNALHCWPSPPLPASDARTSGLFDLPRPDRALGGPHAQQPLKYTSTPA